VADPADPAGSPSRVLWKRHLGARLARRHGTPFEKASRSSGRGRDRPEGGPASCQAFGKITASA